MNAGSLVALVIGLALVSLGVFMVIRPERVRDWERNYYARSALAFRLPAVNSPGYLWYLRLAGAFLILFGSLLVVLGLVPLNR
jgi:hypothetical protein